MVSIDEARPTLIVGGDPTTKRKPLLVVTLPEGTKVDGGEAERLGRDLPGWKVLVLVGDVKAEAHLEDSCVLHETLGDYSLKIVGCTPAEVEELGRIRHRIGKPK